MLGILDKSTRNLSYRAPPWPLGDFRLSRKEASKSRFIQIPTWEQAGLFTFNYKHIHNTIRLYRSCHTKFDISLGPGYVFVPTHIHPMFYSEYQFSCKPYLWCWICGLDGNWSWDKDSIEVVHQIWHYENCTWKRRPLQPLSSCLSFSSTLTICISSYSYSSPGITGRLRFTSSNRYSCSW